MAPDVYDPAAHRGGPPDWDPDPGPPSGRTTAEARRARTVPTAPATITTARGTWRLRTLSREGLPRPYLVILQHQVSDDWWSVVIDWACRTEPDARRVARRLDLDVREGIVR